MRCGKWFVGVIYIFNLEIVQVYMQIDRFRKALTNRMCLHYFHYKSRGHF